MLLFSFVDLLDEYPVAFIGFTGSPVGSGLADGFNCKGLFFTFGYC